MIMLKLLIRMKMTDDDNSYDNNDNCKNDN